MVTVDYYDMGTTLNAFGVYVRERPDPCMEIPGATEALISPPYQALLLKGSRYVKVNVFEGELSETTGRTLLTAIAAAQTETTCAVKVLADKLDASERRCEKHTAKFEETLYSGKDAYGPRLLSLEQSRATYRKIATATWAALLGLAGLK